MVGTTSINTGKLILFQYEETEKFFVLENYVNLLLTVEGQAASRLVGIALSRQLQLTFRWG